MLFDHMQTMKALKNDKKLSNLAGQNGMSLSEYYDLFSPAIEWIMQCVAYQAPIVRFSFSSFLQSFYVSDLVVEKQTKKKTETV